MGFTIPLNNWLKKDLRPWVENQLAKIPNDSEIFNKPMINKIWREHQLSNKDHTDRLWGILCMVNHIK